MSADLPADQASSITFDDVESPDEGMRAEALARAGPVQLSTPVEAAARRAATRGSGLGRLDELAAWVAACQGEYPVRPLRQPRFVTFAADHGIAERGVSAREAGSTCDLVTGLGAGECPLTVVADDAGASVRIIDIGMTHEADAPTAETRWKVCRGSRPLDVDDALSHEQANEALRAGKVVADAEVDSGADLLVAGILGVASSTSASAIVAARTGTEPVAAVGRGSGIDDHAWMRKTRAVRDALRRAQPATAEPVPLLAAIAGADIAAVVGFLTQAAVRRTPALLDGFPVCAAALIAEQLAQGARHWWRAAQLEPEPAHAVALEHLGLEPVLDLGMSRGAAAAVLPLVRMATLAHTGTR